MTDVKILGQCGSCSVFSVTQAVVLQLVLISGGLAWISLSGDLVPTSPVKQYVPLSSWWYMRWSVLSRVRVIADRAGRSLSPSGGIAAAPTSGGSRVDLSALQITSCTPSTGIYGFYGCDGCWTEGAYVHVSIDEGLANFFFVPYVQCLTERRSPGLGAKVVG